MGRIPDNVSNRYVLIQSIFLFTITFSETKSQIVNRMGEIIMIQSLLEEVLKKKQPLILDTFWKNLVSEKQWIGKWENFRDQ